MKIFPDTSKHRELKKLLDYVRSESGVNTADCAAFMHITQGTAGKHLNLLRDDEYVQINKSAKGTNKGRTCAIWVACKSMKQYVIEEAKEPIAKEEKVKFARFTNRAERQEKLLQYMQLNGAISRKEICIVLGIPRGTVHHIIKLLIAQNLIVVVQELQAGFGPDACPYLYALTENAGKALSDDGYDDFIVPTARKWAHGTATRYAMGRAI